MKKRNRLHWARWLVVGSLLLSLLWMAGCVENRDSDEEKDRPASSTEKPAPERPSAPKEEEPEIQMGYNDVLEGTWFYSEDLGESTITFDGLEVYTAVDSYGAYSGGYNYDGVSVELYEDGGVWYTG